jgi:hypothetical protein
MRILAIDDMRDMTQASVVARNYDEGIRQLEINGPWDLLLLDHDLASFDDNGEEYTGYDVMCWLEAHPEFLPDKIECVSANPVGRARIIAVCTNLYRERNGPRDSTS